MATLRDVIRLQGKPEADEELLEILNEQYTMDLDEIAPDGSQLIRTASGAMYDPEYIDVLDWTDTGDTLRVEVILQWQDGNPDAEYEQTHLMVEIEKEMEELSLKRAPEKTVNPIISTLAEYFVNGQRVTHVQPDNRLDPKAIIVHLEDGGEKTHPIDTPNRDHFMKLWKQASAWWQLQWDNPDG